MRPDLVFHC
jgi:hypothetical protein